MVKPHRAIKSFEMTDPLPFKENPGKRSRGRWNILPGTAFAGAFYAERELHPKLEYLSRNRSCSRSIFFRFRIQARDRNRSRSRSTSESQRTRTDPPGQLTQSWRPIRRGYFPRLQTRSFSRNYPKFVI